MRSAGVDFDTRAVWVVRSSERLELGESLTFPGVGISYENLRADEIAFGGRVPFDRGERALRELGVRLDPELWADLDVVGIEDPRATNPLLRSTIGKMNRIFGAIVASIPRDVRVEALNAKEWRVAVGMKGSATKEEVYDWAVDNGFYLHDARTAPQDLADAYAIMRAAERLASGVWSRPPPKARKKRAAA